MKKNSQKGITLIALIITIIILIIILAITFSTILGENGIIQKAQQAIDESKKASLEEQIALITLEKEMQKEIAKITDPNPGELEQINENLYAISSIEDLVGLSNKINSGKETYIGKTIILLNSLDFKEEKSYANSTDNELFGDYNQDGQTEGIKDELIKGRGFIPIGNKADYKETENTISGNKFEGVFDGNNKEIRNILVNVTEDSQLYALAGLFGVTGTNTSIKNLAISGDILCSNNVEKGKNYIGGIIGYNFGNISNCYNKTNIKNGKSYLTYIGGIAGASDAENKYIENCINGGNVEGLTTTSYILTGGIVGYNLKGTIDRNKNETIIKTSNPDGGAIHVGGISGYNYGTIKNSVNIAEVISDGSTGSTFAGGIVGKDFGFIDSCENKGKIVAKNSKSQTFGNFAGGITGESSENTTIINCHNFSDVFIEGSIAKYGYIGGITGKSSGIIENTDNEAVVNSKCEDIGNLFFGGVVGSSNIATIKNVKNNGELKLEGSVTGWIEMGGIAGNCSSGTVIQSSKNTKDINININNGLLTAGGITGFSTETIIEKCINIGNLNIKQNDLTKSIYAGGIVAYNGINKVEKTINQTVNYGNIICDGGSNVYIGGISGFFNNNSMINSYNRGEILSKNNSSWNFSGGLVGSSTSNELLGKIDKCYNSGKVTSIGGMNTYSAGIIAYNLVKVTNSYNTGEINAHTNDTSDKWAYSGGIASLNFGATIENNYNTGKILASTEDNSARIRIGGIVGEQNATSSTNNCYYSSSSANQGIGQNSSGIEENVIKKDDMPTILQVLGDSFKENPNNNKYPMLSWE